MDSASSTIVVVIVLIIVGILAYGIYIQKNSPAIVEQVRVPAPAVPTPAPPVVLETPNVTVQPPPSVTAGA